MSDNSKFNSISHLMGEPVVLATQQVVGAFAGEEVTFEKMPDMPLDLLVEAGALDAVTLAVLLATPHLRDVADVSDIAQQLPEEVVATLVRIKTDFHGTGNEFVDHILCDSTAAAKIRLAQHMDDMRVKAKTMVTDDDQINYFATCMVSASLASNIVEKEMTGELSVGLMRVYAQDLGKHVLTLRELEPDLFNNLMADIATVKKARELLLQDVQKQEEEAENQARIAAEQAEFRASNPFPHPKSPFMRNKGRVKVVFKP